MFEASRSLIAGATIIINSDGILNQGEVETPTLPVIVCCALAIEIGIKALLVLEGVKSFPSNAHGHSLKALFEALPLHMQQEILTFQVQYTGLSPDEAKEKLDEEDTTFIDWRYAYEHVRLHTSPAFLHDFGVAVSEKLRLRLAPSLRVPI